MEREFEMTNLGHMKYFLGLGIEQLKQGSFISQKKYAQDVLTKFRMNNCKPINAPIVPGTKLSKTDEGATVNSTLYKQLVGIPLVLDCLLMSNIILLKNCMCGPVSSF